MVALQSGSATEQRVDLRILKTKRAIRQAFLDLISTTPYNDITVTAIAERALVGRKTFYKHYASIGNLVEEIAHDEVAKFVGSIQFSDEPVDIHVVLEDFTKGALLSLRDMPGIDENFIQSVTLPRFLDFAKPPLVEALARELEKRGATMSPLFTILISYYLSGLCAAYEAWKQEQAGIPLEDLASAISRSASNGLESFIEAS